MHCLKNELRKLLEVCAVRTACERMTEEDLRKFKDLFREMGEKLDSKNYMGYLNPSHEFHEFYVRKCENGRLFNLFRILRNNILAIQVLAYSYPDHGVDSLQEHRSILQAVSKKDPREAEEYVKRHLESEYKRAMKFLKSRAVSHS
jgi:DNA-binding GntR family transcriptional regulator